MTKWMTLVALLGATSAAHAGLGQTVTSIARDRLAMQADGVATTSMGTYDRHEITTSEGVSVREYSARGTAAGGGTVFAVQFDGPGLPDMKTVLGPHYDRYVAATRIQQQRARNHHLMSFDDDGLVVTIVKLPRGFSGEAHLRSATPQGVDVRELR
jgi:hypothetical protein